MFIIFHLNNLNFKIFFNKVGIHKMWVKYI